VPDASGMGYTLCDPSSIAKLNTMKDTTNIVMLGYLLATNQVIRSEIQDIISLYLKDGNVALLTRKLEAIIKCITEANNHVNERLQKRIDKLIKESNE